MWWDVLWWADCIMHYVWWSTVNQVVMPRSPAEAKGLLLSAIRTPDPVCFSNPSLKQNSSS